MLGMRGDSRGGASAGGAADVRGQVKLGQDVEGLCFENTPFAPAGGTYAPASDAYTYAPASDGYADAGGTYAHASEGTASFGTTYSKFRHVRGGRGDPLMVEACTHGACSGIVLLLIVSLATFHPAMDAIEASEFKSDEILLKTHEQGPSLSWAEGCENLEEGTIQRLWLSKTHIRNIPAEHWQVYAQIQKAEGGESKVMMTDVNHWGSSLWVWGSPIYARCKVLESDMAPNFLAEATENRPTSSASFRSPWSGARWTIEVQGPFHPMAMQRLAMDFVSRCNTYFLTSVNCQTYAKSIISATTKEKAANVKLWEPFWQESAVMAIGCVLLGRLGICAHTAFTNRRAVAYLAAMSLYLLVSLVFIYFYPGDMFSPIPLCGIAGLMPHLEFLFFVGLLLLNFLAQWPKGILELQTGFLSDLFGKVAFIPYCLSSATWNWIMASITGFMLNAILWGSWRRYQQECLINHYGGLLRQGFISLARARERSARYSAENGTHVSVSVAAFIASSSFMMVGGVRFLIVGDLLEAGYFRVENALEGCTYREDASLKHTIQIEQMVLLLVIGLLCLALSVRAYQYVLFLHEDLRQQLRVLGLALGLADP